MTQKPSDPVRAAPVRQDDAAYGIVVAPGVVRFERVWSYPAKRSTWLAAGEMELRLGGSVEHVFRNSTLTEHDEPPPAKYAGQAVESRMHGHILACDPPHVLAYTWGETTGEHADALSEVRYELSPAGKDVRLVLTHSKLANRDGMVGVSGGWHSHLSVLADRLAGRTPPGFWRTFVEREADYEKRIPASQRGLA